MSILNELKFSIAFFTPGIPAALFLMAEDAFSSSFPSNICQPVFYCLIIILSICVYGFCHILSFICGMELKIDDIYKTIENKTYGVLGKKIISISFLGLIFSFYIHQIYINMKLFLRPLNINEFYLLFLSIIFSIISFVLMAIMIKWLITITIAKRKLNRKKELSPSAPPHAQVVYNLYKELDKTNEKVINQVIEDILKKYGTKNQ